MRWQDLLVIQSCKRSFECIYYLWTWRTLWNVSHYIRICIIFRVLICSREGKDSKFGVRLLMFSTASFAFSCGGLPGPGSNRIRTLTASTSASEYPGPPGSAPPTVFANSLSIFIIGPGALQLDVIGYLSFDQPCRSVFGPPAGRQRGPTSVPCVRSRQKIAFRHADLGNARISHWSFRRVTRFESRSRGPYKYTGCPITPHNASLAIFFVQPSYRTNWIIIIRNIKRSFYIVWKI